MKPLLLLLVRAYQLTVSPYLGQNCRFYPTCSNYASQAIRTHGALAGSALAARRLCKCHPWHVGGVDLVPVATVAKEATDSSAAVRGCGPS
ncbi:MAG: membrane protein insertion efficiency factor YidD [Herminiimonas sp.]|nr:membrane protein insertion efficiency factor YidD [Herminiimonas sp.]